MIMNKVPGTEKTDFQRDLLKISSNFKYSNVRSVARGAGFEPAWPQRTTGLAGLPPTRLGQPRIFQYSLRAEFPKKVPIMAEQKKLTNVFYRLLYLM